MGSPGQEGGGQPRQKTSETYRGRMMARRGPGPGSKGCDCQEKRNWNLGEEKEVWNTG
jgi:hypothetical protein